MMTGAGLFYSRCSMEIPTGRNTERELSLTYRDGTKTVYEYDDRGYRISETGRSGRWTLWKYDDVGRTEEKTGSGSYFGVTKHD